jgi:hypothetical protein
VTIDPRPGYRGGDQYPASTWLEQQFAAIQLAWRTGRFAAWCGHGMQHLVCDLHGYMQCIDCWTADRGDQRCARCGGQAGVVPRVVSLDDQLSCSSPS